MKSFVMILAFCLIAEFSWADSSVDAGLFPAEPAEFSEAGFPEESMEIEGFETEAGESSEMESGFSELSFEEDLGFTSTAEESEEASSMVADLLAATRFTLKHEVSYKTEEPTGVQNNRSSLRLEASQFFGTYFFLQLDTKLNLFWEDDHRAKAEEKDTLVESNTREAFLQASIANTSIKGGIQILIWGESDGGAITDVISPRDYSELFFISLEESRIGQAMLTVDQFSNWGDWTLFYIPDPKMNTYPEEGTAYYTDPFDGQAEVREEETDDSLEEIGLRWKKTFGKSDLALMAASLIENNFAYELEGFTSSGKWIINKGKERFSMVGLAFNVVQDNFLFKGEWARKDPRSFNNSNYEMIKRVVIDTALGLEYSTGGTTTAGLEATNSHISDWSEELTGTTEDTTTLVAVISKTFLNDDLTIDWMTSYTNPRISFLHLLKASYRWNDHFSLSVEAVYPDTSDEKSDLWIYRNQKQVTLKLKVQF